MIEYHWLWLTSIALRETCLTSSPPCTAGLRAKACQADLIWQEFLCCIAWSYLMVIHFFKNLYMVGYQPDDDSKSNVMFGWKSPNWRHEKWVVGDTCWKQAHLCCLVFVCINTYLQTQQVYTIYTWEFRIGPLFDGDDWWSRHGWLFDFNFVLAFLFYFNEFLRYTSSTWQFDPEKLWLGDAPFRFRARPMCTGFCRVFSFREGRVDCLTNAS